MSSSSYFIWAVLVLSLIWWRDSPRYTKFTNCSILEKRKPTHDLYQHKKSFQTPKAIWGGKKKKKKARTGMSFHWFSNLKIWASPNINGAGGWGGGAEQVSTSGDRWGNWGTGRLRALLKIASLLSGEPGLQSWWGLGERARPTPSVYRGATFHSESGDDGPRVILPVWHRPAVPEPEPLTCWECGRR